MVLCMFIAVLESSLMQDKALQNVNEIHTYMEKIKGLASNDARARESLIRFKETARSAVFALSQENDLKMTDNVLRIRKYVEQIQ